MAKPEPMLLHFYSNEVTPRRVTWFTDQSRMDLEYTEDDGETWGRAKSVTLPAVPYHESAVAKARDLLTTESLWPDGKKSREQLLAQIKSRTTSAKAWCASRRASKSDYEAQLKDLVELVQEFLDEHEPEIAPDQEEPEPELSVVEQTKKSWDATWGNQPIAKTEPKPTKKIGARLAPTGKWRVQTGFGSKGSYEDRWGFDGHEHAMARKYYESLNTHSGGKKRLIDPEGYVVEVYRS